MSGGSEQDRTEAPSRHRLAKARREGSVARGGDLGFVAVLSVVVAFGWFEGARLGSALGLGVRRGLAAVDLETTGAGAFLEIATWSAAPASSLLLTWIGVVFAAVLALEFLQTGPVFALSAVRLDFAKLNPATGLKRLFSLRMLLETAKAVLKLGLYGALAGAIVLAALRAAPAASDAASLARTYGGFVLRLLAGFLGIALAMALLDQIVARRDYLKKMRMSRRDVKREHKDQEGDPRLKQRRKQLHGEFAAASQSLRGVREADVVVANPIHFAVGLRYRPERMDAPVVVARGAHALALRLRRTAFGYGVPVVVDPPLARALYRAVRLDQPVPEALFRPVAALYRQLPALREVAG